MDVNDINKKHKTNFYHDYFTGNDIKHFKFLKLSFNTFNNKNYRK
jgi:hypothetical protein